MNTGHWTQYSDMPYITNCLNERKWFAPKRFTTMFRLDCCRLKTSTCPKTAKSKATENKKKLGRSIEERPESVELRNEFGHWEIDSVLGLKNENEPVVITLVERMTRMCLWIKAKNHTAEAMQEAFEDVVSMFLSKKNQVFKTVTGDNGSEFATLADFEKYGMSVYFTHPYTSCEKGTNECHNKMLRRFIPKGKPISSYTAEDICYFAECINGLPRKILGYRTPEELFELELDKIYAA